MQRLIPLCCDYFVRYSNGEVSFGWQGLIVIYSFLVIILVLFLKEFFTSKNQSVEKATESNKTKHTSQK